MSALFQLPKAVRIKSSGLPHAGALAYFYETGTTNPKDVFTDRARSIPFSHPLAADSEGQFPPIYIDPLDTYKLRLTDSSGVQIDLVDPAFDALFSQSEIDAMVHPIAPTDQEVSAGITPVNDLPVGCVDRYGTNTTPGSTDMSVAFQAAIDMGRKFGLAVTYGATWPYLVTTPLNCTKSGIIARGFTITNTGQQLAVTNYLSTDTPSIIASHTGHVFDCTGSNGITFKDVSVTSGAATPLTCFFLARDDGGGGSIHQFYNCRVRGSFSESILYNYAAEEDHYFGCQFYNVNGGAHAKVGYITSHNIRSLTSTFATIATGNQSTLGHYFYGGSFFNISHNAAADTFYFDNASLVKFFGPHVACNDETGGGRSFIYVDTVNGGSDNWTITGFAGEVGTFVPAYGIYIGDTAAATGNWSVISCKFPHVTNMIKAHANITASGISMFNITDGGIGSGGVDFAGTANSCYDLNIAGEVSAGTFSTPNLLRQNSNIWRNGEVNVTLKDYSSGTDAKGVRLRQVGGLFVLSLLDDSDAVVSNPILVTRSGAAVGNVAIGGGVIATNAADGFAYVPTCAGAPSGTPTGISGYAPIIIDTTDNRLYFYSSGSWRNAGP